jgi:hypothetical protein
MEKEILLKEIENTNHLNDLYQLWNEFKAYLENQPSLLELGQLFGFNYHLQEKFNQLSQLFIQEKKYQESIEFHQDFINYFKDDKYLCPFFKNLAFLQASPQQAYTFPSGSIGILSNRLLHPWDIIGLCTYLCFINSL